MTTTQKSRRPSKELVALHIEQQSTRSCHPRKPTSTAAKLATQPNHPKSESKQVQPSLQSKHKTLLATTKTDEEGGGRKNQLSRKLLP